MIMYLKLRTRLPLKDERDFCDRFAMGSLTAVTNKKEIKWDYKDTEYLLDPDGTGDNNSIFIKECNIDKEYEDGKGISMNDIEDIIYFKEIHISNDNAESNAIQSIDHLAIFNDEGQGIIFSETQYKNALCVD